MIRMLFRSTPSSLKYLYNRQVVRIWISRFILRMSQGTSRLENRFSASSQLMRRRDSAGSMIGCMYSGTICCHYQSIYSLRVQMEGCPSSSQPPYTRLLVRFIILGLILYCFFSFTKNYGYLVQRRQNRLICIPLSTAFLDLTTGWSCLSSPISTNLSALTRASRQLASRHCDASSTMTTSNFSFGRCWMQSEEIVTNHTFLASKQSLQSSIEPCDWLCEERYSYSPAMPNLLPSRMMASGGIFFSLLISRSRMFANAWLVNEVTSTFLPMRQKYWMSLMMSSVLPVPGIPCTRQNLYIVAHLLNASLWWSFKFSISGQDNSSFLLSFSQQVYQMTICLAQGSAVATNLQQYPRVQPQKLFSYRSSQTLTHYSGENSTMVAHLPLLNLTSSFLISTTMVNTLVVLSVLAMRQLSASLISGMKILSFSPTLKQFSIYSDISWLSIRFRSVNSAVQPDCRYSNLSNPQACVYILLQQCFLAFWRFTIFYSHYSKCNISVHLRRQANQSTLIFLSYCIMWGCRCSGEGSAQSSISLSCQGWSLPTAHSMYTLQFWHWSNESGKEGNLRTVGSENKFKMLTMILLRCTLMFSKQESGFSALCSTRLSSEQQSRLNTAMFLSSRSNRLQNYVCFRC